MIPQRERYLNAVRKRISKEWFDFLEEEFTKDYFIKLVNTVARARTKGQVYPEPENVFRAYNLVPPEEVKVVIVGQDPYHDGSATGLAFGTINDNPSLQKILKQLEFYEEFGELKMCPSREPTLEYLADQGVLLLNRVLTVAARRPKSHANIGWEIFTGRTIFKLSTEYDGIVYMLWGNDAKTLTQVIDYFGNMVVTAEHPAYAARQQRPWKDNVCFSKANEFLKKFNRKEINW